MRCLRVVSLDARRFVRAAGKSQRIYAAPQELTNTIAAAGMQNYPGISAHPARDAADTRRIPPVALAFCPRVRLLLSEKISAHFKEPSCGHGRRVTGIHGAVTSTDTIPRGSADSHAMPWVRQNPNLSCLGLQASLPARARYMGRQEAETDSIPGGSHSSSHSSKACVPSVG